MLLCEDCLERAKNDKQFLCERETFSKFSEFLGYLVSDTLDLSSLRNVELLSFIMHRLAILQSHAIDEEIHNEMLNSKTHLTLRQNSQDVEFLLKSERNIPLIRTLLGFSKMEYDTDISSLSRKKAYALCTAYEAILGARHSNVTTSPAVMRNMVLLKKTHNRQSVQFIGAPTGGMPTMLNSILNSPLPLLCPPDNDFVSCDDNLQVKRVVSSSKLKEGFKHSVKVVNSHIYLQNEGDQLGHILKNEDNKPMNWLRKPT